MLTLPRVVARPGAVAPALPVPVAPAPAGAAFSPFGLLLPLLVPAVLLSAWALVTQRAWVSEHVLVAPAAVLEAARDLVASGELRQHLSISLVRLATGFGLGASCALAFGIALGASRTFEDYWRPLFDTFRQIPTFALVPAFILLFGVEETFKVVLVAKATFFPIALAAFDGVRGIPRPYLEVAAVNRMPRRDRLRQLILPATLPTLAAGVRISLGRSWMVLVAAELMAAESGIGQMMEMGRQMFRMDIVMVGVFLTGAIGLGLDQGFRRLERRLTGWRRV